MGVGGLMKYLELHCPEAWTDNVRIADVIENCWEETGRRPEIVVDGSVCYSMWTRGLDWTVGLQVGELKMRLTRFVNAFRQLDADLVFFFDGLTPLKKRKTWLERRRGALKIMDRVYDGLQRGIPFDQLPPYIPPNMTNFVTFFLKYELNCRVYVTVYESDEEIVDYVTENKNSVIFTFDSDFIVSYIDSPVLSSSTDHFNMETMTTRLYDRRKLNSHLNLKPIELPYLGILAGNDLVKRQSLQRFHRKITRRSQRSNKKIPFRTLIKGVAKYINVDLPRDRSSNNHMKTICSDMFGNRVKTPFLRLAHKSYIPNRRSPRLLDDSPWSQVLIEAKKLMRNVILPVSAWAVLSAYIYETSPVLEDYTVVDEYDPKARDLPCATITRNLRKRWYGILLYENRDECRPVVEWCAENLHSYKHPVLVDPEYPTAYHPGLRALWDPDLADIYQPVKWNLFLKTVSPNIKNVEEWMSLPEDLVVSAAACYYLYEELYLNFDELRAILLTLLMFKFYDLTDLRIMRRSSDSDRARQITITFSRTYSIIFSAFATCGYPIRLSKNIAYIKLEPRLFEEIFEEIRVGTTIGEYCFCKAGVLVEFFGMMEMIHESCDRLSE